MVFASERKARKKLNLWAFKRLSKVPLNSFYENNEVYTRYGMRLMVVDGNRLFYPITKQSRVNLEFIHLVQRSIANGHWHFALCIMSFELNCSRFTNGTV
jgi:hypothetical protein